MCVCLFIYIYIHTYIYVKIYHECQSCPIGKALDFLAITRKKAPLCCTESAAPFAWEKYEKDARYVGRGAPPKGSENHMGSVSFLFFWVIPILPSI